MTVQFLQTHFSNFHLQLARNNHQFSNGKNIFAQVIKKFLRFFFCEKSAISLSIYVFNSYVYLLMYEFFTLRFLRENFYYFSRAWNKWKIRNIWSQYLVFLYHVGKNPHLTWIRLPSNISFKIWFLFLFSRIFFDCKNFANWD